MSGAFYSLLREKFTIHPKGEDESQITKTALSNRFALNLITNGTVVETYILRAQNMHSCARMAAKMLQDFGKLGPLGVREASYWADTWDNAVSAYEKRFNPNLWIAIYKNGRPVFSEGERHPFLDVIEQCDAHQKGEYDNSIKLAETAFNQAGQDVSIKHVSNIAMNLEADGSLVRCSLLVRSPRATKTFSANIQADDPKSMNVAHVITAAAAFLEGVELCFMIGTNGVKISRGLILSPSEEEKQTIGARKRIIELDQILDGLEKRFTLRYRPERPAFEHIINDTEMVAEKLYPATIADDPD